MNKNKKFALFIEFIVISIFIAIYSSYLDTSHISNSVDKFVTENHLLSIFLYTTLFSILAIFSFSVSVMTSIGAVFFSIYEITIYASIGIIISATAHFYIARKLGRDYVRNYIEKKGGKLEKFDEILEKNSFKTILILSAVFFVPPMLPNLLGGIIKINF